MVGDRTHIGGRGDRFLSTHWSTVLRAKKAEGDDRLESMDRLIRLYWKPVYAFVRAKWGKTNEDAKDLTQAFFVDLLNRDFLSKVGPEKGKFRTFVRSCLENFLRNQWDAERAKKRGGDKVKLSLDYILPDDDLQNLEASSASPEEVYDRKWRSAILRETARQVEVEYHREGRDIYCQVFKTYYAADGKVSYAQIGKQLGLKESDVTNYLSHVRTRFKKIRESIVLDTVSGEDLVQEEVSELFGGDSMSDGDAINT